MPSTVKEADAYYLNCGLNREPWSCWPVPVMPDLTTDPWAGVSVPWKEPVAGRPVDYARTAKLADVDIEIAAQGGDSPWAGAATGFPFQIIASKGTTTPVWDLARAPVWSFSWATGFVRRDPIVQVPLPELVRLEGDPNGAFDVHFHGFDPTEQVLFEMISVNRSGLNRLKTWGTTDWTAGYTGGAPGIARWNCKIAWNAPSQPFGCVAAGIPQFPLVARYDEVLRGRINHSLFLGVPNYGPELVGVARGGDGTAVGHPLRGGERLRLKRSVVEQFPLGTPARIVAEAGWEYGAIVADRNSWDPKAGTKDFGRGALTLTMDARWQGARGGVPLGRWATRLTDWEVIVP
ncbi:MAG: hypothetical protein ACOYOQ_00455 [Microthrixaceae bacterium]